jgi:CubicO group peptidase (beta-lactamase class C family)
MRFQPIARVVCTLACCLRLQAVESRQVMTNSTTDTLEAIRKKHNFPALAVAVVQNGELRDLAAVGVRKSGDPTLVTTNDQFHIGSCTKSMTATLAGILIDEGKLKWETTIAEVFPELKTLMDPAYRKVTLHELLTHHGGAPGRAPGEAWERASAAEGTPRQQRYEFIKAVLSEPPEAVPGSKYIYSNQGYAIAGAMLEKATGTPWEELITEKLFKPLGMSSAGFGPPGTKGKVDEPWGHAKRLLMTLPSQRDNPPAIAPAGRVHCSLQDLARYCILHLEGERRGGLVTTQTMRMLHTPFEGKETDGTRYACGWISLERKWAGKRALMHNGSNTMWYIVIWLAPEKDFGVIAASNLGADDAAKGCDEAAGAMIKKWLIK